MSKWKILGVILGVSLGASARAIAECAYEYDYDRAELSIVSVDLDGLPVADLAAYDGYDVSFEAGGAGEGTLFVSRDGVELTREWWK